MAGPFAKPRLTENLRNRGPHAERKRLATNGRSIIIQAVEAVSDITAALMGRLLGQRYASGVPLSKDRSAAAIHAGYQPLLVCTLHPGHLARPPLFHRISTLIALCAAIQILGGHWLALQSVAWLGMVAQYSQGASLATAIEKTFDGKHPCSLCKAVKTGRENEQKQVTAKVIVKIEAVLASFAVVPQPVVGPWEYPGGFSQMPARPLAPLTPPPLA